MSSVALPATVPAAERRLPPPLSVQEGPILRALVIDADDRARHLTQRVLMRLGLEVLVAASGDDAVALSRAERPDFVLAGIDGDRRDGFDAVRRVREIHPEVHLPVLFITDARDEQALLDAYANGGDVIRTPLTEALLRVRIGAALNMRHLHETVSTQRDQLLRYHDGMQHDLDTAKTILGNFATEEALAASNVKFTLQPMETLNGDFVMAARRPAGGQCFILGDFTGHGLPAAIGVLVVHGVFCSMVAKGFDTAVVASEINRKMYELLPVDRFLSAVLIDLEPGSNIVTIWNGGMPAVMIRAADGTVRERVASAFLPLGILPQDQFTAQPVHIELAAGERVLAYSDGVVETISPEGELFGEERLEASLGRCADDAISLLEPLLAAFRGDQPQRDDVSLLEVGCVSSDIRVDGPEQQCDAPRHAARTWRLGLVLDDNIIRSQDPITGLIGLAETLQGFGPQASDLYLVISALYIDAIDNGLLGLGDCNREAIGAARYFAERQARLDALEPTAVHIDLEHAPTPSGGELHIRVSHDGPPRAATASPDSVFNHRRFRRGGSALRSLVDTLRSSDEGRSVSVTYNWTCAATTTD